MVREVRGPAALLVLVAGVLLGPLCAQAAVISRLNTGVDATGNPLSLGSLDASYQLVSSPDPQTPGPNLYVINAAGGPASFPFGGLWMPNNSASQWLVPYANGVVSLSTASAGGLYTFRTTFDLTGFDLSSASIAGQWAADNVGRDILLNGQSIGAATPNPGFSGFAPFSIGSGFVNGVNTLDFVVFNSSQASGNPTGLRVEGAITAEAASPIPEPSSMALVAISLLVCVQFARRKAHDTACSTSVCFTHN